MSHEKRPDLAIQIARRAGLPLKLAAKVDRVDREYFKNVVKPLLSTPGIEFIGEINEGEKQDFLGDALALLFPVDWPEPFGRLVMIEALACGTPVIARPCGSVPEVLRQGVTGFLATDLDDLVAAAGKIDQISRARCREEFDQRFTAQVMAAHYERIYYELTATNWKARHAALTAKKGLPDSALAWYAARRWRPALDDSATSIRWKERAAVYPLFSNGRGANPGPNQEEIEN
jgi:glycosyltransferase involved in cell wall biosynthesis